MASNFRIQVKYDSKEYEVNVTRLSPGVTPNSYFAHIISEPTILNKYPTVEYTAINGKLLYEDKLLNIFPGFAEIQKEEIIKYLDENGIDL